MEKVAYNITVQSYYQAQDIIVAENCNGYTVSNVGGTDASINGIPLLKGVPGVSKGDSVTIGGNLGEIYKGIMRLSFAVGGGGTVPQVVVIQKFYIK